MKARASNHTNLGSIFRAAKIFAGNSVQSGANDIWHNHLYPLERRVSREHDALYLFRATLHRGFPPVDRSEAEQPMAGRRVPH